MAGRQDGSRGTAGAGGEAWERELLDLLRPGDPDLGKVTAWLARTVDGTAGLLDDTGALLAGAPAPWDERLAGDIVTGRIAAASRDEPGHHQRLVRVGHPRPGASGVLTVTREDPFDRRTADIVTHTVRVLELLLTARERASADLRLARASADLRLAILQLLMVEDTVSARRVAAGLWPGLLDTDTARVYVLETCPGERDRIAEECLDATRGRALVVRCPAVDQHVIVVAPRDAAGDDLRSVTVRRPGTFLGGSTPQALAHTATAYGQAVSALAVARFRPDQHAVYAERTHPERLLDPAALHRWSVRLLRPLDALAHHTRAELLATTRLGLEFPAVSAAKIMGVSRNTVRARRERLESLLGADLSDLTDRAVLHLALNAQAAHGGSGAADPAPVPFDELLTGLALRAWAHGLLARLDTDARDLRRTLRVWIAEGGNAERAAHALGMHPQTVRDHVRSAEPVLERQLLAAGGDLYEVVLALLAVGDLRPPALGRTNPDRPDAPVHG
ncbi:helix-turn-helix domain-containing protein [Streptomyces sp. NPDC087425]|uniref:helix-turn-helix domain-containing protein n=1 Tax=Streptomyces sp. NPDC087425 TaxID=3365787 RepID=UPI0037FC87BE